MPSYNFPGILEPSPIREDILRCSNTIINDDDSPPIVTAELNSIFPFEEGSENDNYPIPWLVDTKDGTKVDSFLDDYYYRIHLLPNPLEFGFIIDNVEKNVLLWNSFFVGKRCTAINKENEDEYIVDGLTAPFILSALESTTYKITAPQDGSPELNASIFFDFGVDIDYVLLIITGTRINLFRWCPLQPMMETLEWLTDIIRAKDGTEQRISVRRVARQGFQLSVLFNSQREQAKCESLLHKWQKRAFGLPVWTEWELHTTTINAGALSISVNTTNADFRNSGLAVIWKSETEYEVINVGTVAAGSLTLTTPVANTFTGAKYIMPVRFVQMNIPVTRKDAPDGYSIMEFGFAVTDNIELSGYSPNVSYKGLPVLSRATYVEDMQDKTSDGDIAISDYETGKFLIYSDSDFNRNTQSHLFKYFTKAACWNHRLFLHYLLGQLNCVWIPSFKKDMVVTQTIGSTETVFTIQNVGLSKYMGLNALRTHVVFIFDDNTVVCREITGFNEIDDDEETVSIDAALGDNVDGGRFLGAEIAPGECLVCFLDKYRLADDSVEINWEHKGWNTNQLLWERVKA